MNSLVRKIYWRMRGCSYADIAAQRGVQIGEGCKIICEPYSAFGTEPYLIKIGNNVEITSGVRFITHDGAAWVLRNNYGLKDLDIFGRIVVGDNVFIGIDSIILPGVTIGSNVIVGAGAVVTKDLESGNVYGGIPARRICSIEDYKERAMEKGLNTHHMSEDQKKEELRRIHPDWFEDDKKI